MPFKTLGREELAMLPVGWYWVRRVAAVTTYWTIAHHRDDDLWDVMGRDYALYSTEMCIVEVRGPLSEPPDRTANGFGEVCP